MLLTGLSVYRLWKTVVRLWALQPVCALAAKARLVPTFCIVRVAFCPLTTNL